jgi:hypothetical protein
VITGSLVPQSMIGDLGVARMGLTIPALSYHYTGSWPNTGSILTNALDCVFCSYQSCPSAFQSTSDSLDRPLHGQSRKGSQPFRFLRCENHTMTHSLQTDRFSGLAMLSSDSSLHWEGFWMASQCGRPPAKGSQMGPLSSDRS